MKTIDIFRQAQLKMTTTLLTTTQKGIRMVAEGDDEITWLASRMYSNQLKGVLDVLRWLEPDKSIDVLTKKITDEPLEVAAQCLLYLNERIRVGGLSAITIMDIKNSIKCLSHHPQALIDKMENDDKCMKIFHDTLKTANCFDDAFYERCAEAVLLPVYMSFVLGEWPSEEVFIEKNRLIKILSSLYMRLKKICEDNDNLKKRLSDLETVSLGYNNYNEAYFYDIFGYPKRMPASKANGTMQLLQEYHHLPQRIIFHNDRLVGVMQMILLEIEVMLCDIDYFFNSSFRHKRMFSSNQLTGAELGLEELTEEDRLRLKKETVEQENNVSNLWTLCHQLMNQPSKGIQTLILETFTPPVSCRTMREPNGDCPLPARPPELRSFAASRPCFNLPVNPQEPRKQDPL